MTQNLMDSGTCDICQQHFNSELELQKHQRDAHNRQTQGENRQGQDRRSKDRPDRDEQKHERIA